METLKTFAQGTAKSPADRAVNDNLPGAVAFGRSIFPPDAAARIFRPSRAVTTSAKRSAEWRLVFERRTPPFIEPLMGYCGGDDTLTQVQLRFETLEAAVRYAERQGLTYVVQGDPRSRRTADAQRGEENGRQAFSDMVLEKLGLTALQDSYGLALASAANDNAAPSMPGGTVAAPMDVVNDPGLSLSDKRAMLMNWAWNEYLIDQATAEGMPENGRPSLLHEVELALLALERQASPEMAGGDPAPSPRLAA